MSKRFFWLALLALSLTLSFTVQAHAPGQPEESSGAVAPTTPQTPYATAYYSFTPGTPRALAAYEFSWAAPALKALPGQAWNIELVGHHDLDQLGWWGGLGLAETCAYVGSYTHDHVPIVDVSQPQNPQVVGGIALPAGAEPVELRALPERDLLLIADEGSAQLYAYDISDCAQPKLLSSYQLPRTPHEFFLWHDASRVLAYVTTFDDPAPNLVVVDYTDPANPSEAGRWTARAAGVEGLLHSISVSSAGDRAYLSLWDGGALLVDINLPEISVVRDAQGAFAPAVMPNTHSVVPFDDGRYAILAAEVFNCPFEGLSMVDLADPAHAEIVAGYLLPENRCDDLPAGGPTFAPHNPTVAGDFVFASWYAAGLQVIDWRNRLQPQRVAQYVPSAKEADSRSLLGTYPVQTFSYPILRDGLIYFTDSASGLYIVRYTGPGAEDLNALPRIESNLTIRP